MREIPILFTPAMVRAIDLDIKNMSRRIIKPQPTADWMQNTKQFSPDGSMFSMTGKQLFWLSDEKSNKSDSEIRCPFGKPGDRLWVKEGHYRFGGWRKDGVTKTGRQKWRFYHDVTLPDDLTFRFLNDPPASIEKNSARSMGWYKRSPLFMPKKFARLWLEVAMIRVERLRAITEADAFREGSVPPKASIIGCKNGAFGFFEQLWKSINGQESWDEDPWVWVILFKKLAK